MLAAAIAIFVCHRHLRPTDRPDDRFRWLYQVAGAYTALAFATSILFVKSGSNLNYLLELLAVVSLLIGLLAGSCWSRRRDKPVPAIVLATVLTLQAAVLPAPSLVDPEGNADLRGLAMRVAATAGPVISDEMVILLKAGKTVPWEPAIFGELAATGRWGEQHILDLIKQHHFALIITQGDAGEARFDERYSPAMRAALATYYQVRERFGAYLVRVPAP